MKNLGIWVSASSGDVAIRLMAQLASTIIIARILSAEEFGLATLVLVIATVMGALIGFPLEEALSQKKRLHREDLETALLSSIVLSAGVLALALLAGPTVERLSTSPGFATLSLIAAVLLIAEGPRAIARAMARRHHKFVELAGAQAFSTVLACILAVLAAMAGWGVYALMIQRLLPNVLFPIIMFAGLTLRGTQAWVTPRWHRARFTEIWRFCGLYLVDTGIAYTSPAVLAFLVNAFFGIAALGQLNIALRIVDPLRAGLLGIGHNLIFSRLVKQQHDTSLLATSASRIAASVAIFVVPAFGGLAVSAPVMLPMLVGPNWEDAVPLSQILCIAAGISLPFRSFATGNSALGRPELNVAVDVLALATMSIVFIAAAWVELDYVAGIAFLAGEMSMAIILLVFAWDMGGKNLLPALRRICLILAATMVMIAVVHVTTIRGATDDHSVFQLIKIIGLGVMIFPIALLILCPRCLRDLSQSFVSKE